MKFNMVRVVNEYQENKKLGPPEFNDSEIRKANRILSQIANVVENAFSGFETEWEDKPRNIDRKNIDGELFVQLFKLKVNVSGIIFAFEISLSNYFSKKFTKPRVSFTLSGYEMRTIDITPMVGIEITNAAKIAQRLQKEITIVLKSYEKNNL